MKGAIMNQISMVIDGGMLLIGKLSKNHEHWTLEEPRMMMMVPQPNGQMMINLSPFPGQPKSINFGPEVKYCVPTDEGVINTYIQMTSNIKIVSSLPKGN